MTRLRVRYRPWHNVDLKVSSRQWPHGFFHEDFTLDVLYLPIIGVVGGAVLLAFFWVSFSLSARLTLFVAGGKWFFEWGFAEDPPLLFAFAIASMVWVPMVMVVTFVLPWAVCAAVFLLIAYLIPFLGGHHFAPRMTKFINAIVEGYVDRYAAHSLAYWILSICPALYLGFVVLHPKPLMKLLAPIPQ